VAMAVRGGFGRGYGRGCGTGDRPTCQIYEKIGHNVGRCWKGFDREFKLEEKSANNALNTGDIASLQEKNIHSSAFYVPRSRCS
jgi:hypothetical protein